MKKKNGSGNPRSSGWWRDVIVVPGDRVGCVEMPGLTRMRPGRGATPWVRGLS